MPFLSRRELAELADDRDRCAVRSARAARSAARDATDPQLTPATRRQAAAQAPISRRQAAAYRMEATALRAGHQPDSL